MSSGPTGWLPLIITTLGAGAIGSMITTYGTQGRQRLDARSNAMACLERIEANRGLDPIAQGLQYNPEAFAELHMKCLVAGVPRHLVRTYERVSELSADLPKHPDAKADRARYLMAALLTERAGVLIRDALWHPLLSRTHRRRRVQKIRRIASELLPDWQNPLDLDGYYAYWRSLTARTPYGAGITVQRSTEVGSTSDDSS
jgi:hypothetical protein